MFCVRARLVYQICFNNTCFNHDYTESRNYLIFQSGRFFDQFFFLNKNIAIANPSDFKVIEKKFGPCEFNFRESNGSSHTFWKLYLIGINVLKIHSIT